MFSVTDMNIMHMRSTFARQIFRECSAVRALSVIDIVANLAGRVCLSS